MKKRIIVGVVLVLMVCAAFGAFAADKQFPWMASYNKPGQFNVYGSVGFYGLGIDLNAGPEIIIGQFEIGPVPLEWGVMVRGMLGFAGWLGYTWIDWAVAPAVSLHWGLDFGSPWKFDIFVAAGAGINGSAGTYYAGYGSGAIGFTFATFNGVSWQFSKNFGLIVEYGYTYYLSTFGVGIKWSL
jgi:hypothetical protein